MSGAAVLIREIHRLRRFIRDLQEQVDRAPRQLKLQQAKVAHQEELQSHGQDGLKQLKVHIHEMEVSLKATHSTVAKHLKQLETAESKKEYDALQLEIKNERAQAIKFEDDILAAMMEVEERTANLPVLAENVVKAKKEFAEWEKGSSERLANQQAQLAEAKSQLKEIEAQLPAKHVTQYLRLINAMGPDAMSSVENRNCVACATEITAQMHNELLMENFVPCKACGRILYLPETPR